MILICEILCLFFLSSAFARRPTIDAELYKEYKFINFAFPDNQSSWEYLQNEHYRNVTFNGIKLDENDNIYGSFPRWKSNVPVTLAKLNPETNLFEAFPNWEMNSLNNTDPTKRINSVLGFEIDRKNRMWILDQSHINGQSPCPENSIKLIIYDMTLSKVEYTHHFSDTIAPRTTSFLNDIVIDPIQDIGYIADSGIGGGTTNYNPGIIVFDYKKKTAKRYLSKHPTVMPNTTLRFETDHVKCLKNAGMETGIDGIAMTCDYKRIYFCPLTSHKIYGIDTSILLNGNETEISKSVFEIGDKGTVSDGLVLGGKGGMFFGNIEGNGIQKSKDSEMNVFISKKENNKGKIPKMEDLVGPGKDEMVWQDTLALTKKKKLWWTSNNLCNWLNGLLKYDEFNYRIWTMKVEEKSYMEGCYKEPVTPPTPKPSGKKKIELWKIIVIIGSCVILFTCAVFYIGCVVLSAAVVICTKKQIGDYEKL